MPREGQNWTEQIITGRPLDSLLNRTYLYVYPGRGYYDISQKFAMQWRKENEPDRTVMLFSSHMNDRKNKET